MPVFRTIVFLIIMFMLPVSYTICRGVVFLHTNDFHGHLTGEALKDGTKQGGIDRLAYAVELEKKKARLQGMDVILLDSGDFFMGSPEADHSGGLDLVELTSLIGYNVMTLGNHEFDRGLEGLLKILEQLKVPMVCSNLKYESGDPVKGILPWKILSLESIKIGVTGLMTPDLPSITSASAVKGLKIEDPFSAATRAAFEMRSKGADFVLILSHLGYEYDKELAQSISGIDLIIGGHSHTPVINPVRHGKNSVFVAQAGFYGHYLGRIIYTFNESMPFKGTIMRITSDKYGKMPLVNRSIEKINKAVDNALGAKKGVAARDILASIPADIIEKHSGQELVDYVNTHLNKSIKCFLGPQKRVIVSETASGNMVADAMRFASNADIAIQNGGGVRSGIKAGDVTLKHIYSVMPFKNDLVKVRAKGSVVIDLAERIVAKYEYGFGVVSGMQIFFNPMAPEFSRVKRVLVNNEEIDSQKYYTLATNAFLLNGGDSYTQFSKTEVIKEFEPKSIQDCIAEYISINSPFSVKTEERLKIVNE